MAANNNTERKWLKNITSTITYSKDIPLEYNLEDYGLVLIIQNLPSEAELARARDGVLLNSTRGNYTVEVPGTGVSYTGLAEKPTANCYLIYSRYEKDTNSVHIMEFRKTFANATDAPIRESITWYAQDDPDVSERMFNVWLAGADSDRRIKTFNGGIGIRLPHGINFGVMRDRYLTRERYNFPRIVKFDEAVGLIDFRTG